MLRENDMPGGWVAVFVLCLLLAGAVYVAYEGWTAHSGDVELPGWGYALLGVGVIFGLVIGCGLMALAFYSSRSGHDERAIFKQQEDRDGEDRH
jgi:heme/copper-type cytochrome/quinol oxidase subunit 2